MIARILETIASWDLPVVRRLLPLVLTAEEIEQAIAKSKAEAKAEARKRRP